MTQEKIISIMWYNITHTCDGKKRKMNMPLARQATLYNWVERVAYAPGSVKAAQRILRGM